MCVFAIHPSQLYVSGVRQPASQPVQYCTYIHARVWYIHMYTRAKTRHRKSIAPRHHHAILQRQETYIQRAIPSSSSSSSFCLFLSTWYALWLAGLWLNFPFLLFFRVFLSRLLQCMRLFLVRIQPCVCNSSTQPAELFYRYVVKVLFSRWSHTALCATVEYVGVGGWVVTGG